MALIYKKATKERILPIKKTSISASNLILPDKNSFKFPMKRITRSKALGPVLSKEMEQQLRDLGFQVMIVIPAHREIPQQCQLLLK
jgi:hypothetical protein